MAVFRGRGATSVLLLFWALGILCLSVFFVPPALQAQSLPLYAVHHFDDQLETIDPLTGATLTSATITLAGQTVQGSWGLDKDPTSAQLLFYALLQLQGQTGRELVTIDPGSGTATDVATPDLSLGPSRLGKILSVIWHCTGLPAIAIRTIRIHSSLSASQTAHPPW